MTNFLIGTAIIILSAIGILALAAFYPSALGIWVFIPILVGGGFQVAGFIQERPGGPRHPNLF